MQRSTKAALVLLLLFLAGCNPEPEAVIHLNGATMGTTYHITLVNPGELRSDKLKEELDFQLKHFNTIASTYIEDSELNKLNRSSVGEWHEVSPPLYAMLNIATEVSWLSGGAFDVTIGPLVDLWGFGPEEAHGVPDDDAIAAALKNIGYTQLEIDMLETKVLRRAPVQIDLSAVAKGYGVDAAAVWLESLGVTDYLVEIGGEMRVEGKSPRGDAWRVGVENPNPGATETLPIRLTSIAVATSGAYRNYFEEGGRRYSHTIDPRTGRPITHRLASVTVLDPSCAYADAMATAFSVMGVEHTLEVANRQGIPVYIIEKTDDGFTRHYSNAFAPYLEEQ